MVGILQDPNYANSLWGNKLLESLLRALREKRIAFCELTDACPSDLDGVFVIASERGWIASVLSRLNAGGHRPILLCNQAAHLPACLYSSVCSDLAGSMKDVLDHLKRMGKTAPALYGINPESVSDLGRAESLDLWHGTPLPRFANEGSLKACFAEFYPRRGEFDAVICPNDFAAVSLVRRLRECGDRLTVVSCSSSRISAHYPEITSLSINFETFGRAAVYLYETLAKHPNFSALTVKLKWSFDTVSEEKRTVTLPASAGDDRFYKDPEFCEMLITERLLSVSDPTEEKILHGICEGKTTEQIAEECFLSPGSVKYHVKRLISMSGARDREHMISLLSVYWDR